MFHDKVSKVGRERLFSKSILGDVQKQRGNEVRHKRYVSECQSSIADAHFRNGRGRSRTW